MKPEMLALLCCPVTHSPLKLAAGQQLGLINAVIGRGELKTANGIQLKSPLQAALLSEDGLRIYRIENEIPILLADESIAADQIEGLN